MSGKEKDNLPISRQTSFYTARKFKYSCYRGGLSAFCQGGCDEETVVPTTERCCRCLEPEAACNEITSEDLLDRGPGYKCNEVDYDDFDGSCNISGNTKSSEEKTVATVLIDVFGLRASEPGDEVLTALKSHFYPLYCQVRQTGQTAVLHTTAPGCPG